MKTTIETQLFQRLLALNSQDQVDVLGYIEHVQKVRRINDATRYQENALREIRKALTQEMAF